MEREAERKSSDMFSQPAILSGGPLGKKRDLEDFFFFFIYFVIFLFLLFFRPEKLLFGSLSLFEPLRKIN